MTLFQIVPSFQGRRKLCLNADKKILRTSHTHSDISLPSPRQLGALGQNRSKEKPSDSHRCTNDTQLGFAGQYPKGYKKSTLVFDVTSIVPRFSK